MLLLVSDMDATFAVGHDLFQNCKYDCKILCIHPGRVCDSNSMQSLNKSPQTILNVYKDYSLIK